MPVGEWSQYAYTDDSALGSEDKTFKNIKAALEKDLNSLSHYFHQCHWVKKDESTQNRRLWEHPREAWNAHARSVDIVLISSMQLVSRTITPTPLRIKRKHFITETHRLAYSPQFHPDRIDSI